MNSNTSLRSRFIVLSLAACVFWVGGLCGCDDKADADASGKSGQAKQGQAVAKPVRPALEVPADVVAYGGTKAFDGFIAAAYGLASKVVPGVPPFPAMIAPGLQAEVGLGSADVLDLKKALRFAIFDPKAHPDDPEALIIGITNQKAFTDALPASKKAGEAGDALMYTKHDGAKPGYVNFIDGFVVLTREAGLFRSHEAFLTGLSTLKLEADGEAIFAMSNVVKIYSAEIDAGIANAKAQMKQGIEVMPTANAGQAAMLDTMLDWVGLSANALDEVRVTVRVLEDGAQLGYSIRAREGTDLHGQLGAFAGRGSKLVDRFPADAPFVTAWSVDPALIAPLVDKIYDSVIVQLLFGGDPAGTEPFRKAMTDFVAAGDGEFALASHDAFGGQGLAITGLFGVEDAAAMRAAYSAAASMYQHPKLVAYYDQMGMAVEYKANDHLVGSVQVAMQKTSMKSGEPQMMAMMGMFSDLMTQYIAVGDELGIVGYGSDGKAGVAAFLSGKVPGGLAKAKGPSRALKHALPNWAFFMYVSPVELAKRLRLGGMNPLSGALSGIETETGLGISAAAAPGELRMLIDVPLEMAQKGFQAFQTGQQAF